jgi:RsiW-degrading membrane proteinase PrsW (M82 family)
VAFGGRPFALPWSFAVFTIVVGFVEEGSKLGAAMFAARRKEFDEPIDGVVYGIVSSLGFAAAENFQFFAIGRLAAPLVIARAFMSIPAHMFFGAIWGYALGARLVDPKRRLVLWLAASAALHGLFDALLSMEGGGTLALALNTVLASVFVALVRRSLRHGVIDPEARAVKPEDRLLFRVGRPHRFWMSAVALHVLAFGLFMLGAWYQLARHRPSLGFVIGSSVLLLLLAAAAYGVSASLPLDVAVDSYGITFAGAARPWKKIRKSVQKGDHIEVDCEAGPLLLGPAPEAQINAIAAAIKGHLGATPQDRSITLESPFN